MTTVEDSCLVLFSTIPQLFPQSRLETQPFFPIHSFLDCVSWNALVSECFRRHCLRVEADGVGRVHSAPVLTSVLCIAVAYKVIFKNLFYFSTFFFLIIKAANMRVYLCQRAFTDLRAPLAKQYKNKLRVNKAKR